MPTIPSLLVAAACLLLPIFLWLRKSKSAPAPLPPGPKPVPLLGNIRELRPQELWLPANDWAKQYGDVVYLHIFGIGLVFLNSAEATFDLLDKRGSIYSDKPSLVMAGELCGCKNMVAFTCYGEQSKRQRRLIHKALGGPTIPSYYPLVESSTHTLLRRILSDPSDYFNHVKRYAGTITLSVIYGYEPAQSNDPFIHMAEDCVDILANEIASGGGIWPVDVFPSLQYLPKWMPGAGFLSKAEVWKKKMEDFVDLPYEYVKNSLKSGNYKPSFCSTLLEDISMQTGKEAKNFEFDLKWAANSMYSASIDTTTTALSNFLLAMMQNPDIQRKAQDEIDAVVGTDRLPTFADRPSLPYIEAVYLETLRWTVPVPLGLPHRLMEDDVYKGMFIPKGTLVFGNIWAMLRDENLYPDPESFIPERFLEEMTPDVKRKRNPRDFVFGFGRRQCPGLHLVDSSVWLLIASLLATLKISKAVDEHGNVVDPEVKYENPIFRTPNEFKYDMRPRSEKALSLIKMTDGLGF